MKKRFSYELLTDGNYEIKKYHGNTNPCRLPSKYKGRK